MLLGVDGRSDFNGLHSASTTMRSSSTPSTRLRTGEVGPEPVPACVPDGVEGYVSKYSKSAYRGGAPITGSRSRTGSTRPTAAWRTGSEKSSEISSSQNSNSSFVAAVAGFQRIK